MDSPSTVGERRTLTAFWVKLRANFARIPFVEDAVAAWYCATDVATPASVKALLIGALAYFVVPFDIIPDFIAVLGFTDDAAVLAATIATVRRYITPEHYARAREWVTRQGEAADAA